MAASVIGSIATVAAVVIAIPIGLLFDGSLLPLHLGVLAMAVLGYLLMLRMGRIEARQPA
jgi:DHA1 family bicyclomycin/chloramphenicol resistance-like MFS transporter